LIATGALSVVRLPAARHRNGAAVVASCRRILVDRLDCDRLVDSCHDDGVRPSRTPSPSTDRGATR
jgi:predicted nucleotidyltransferase